MKQLTLKLLVAAAIVGCGATPDDVDGPDAALGTVEQAVTINGGDLGGADLIPNNGDVLSGTFTNVGLFHVKAGVTVTVQPGIILDVTSSSTIIDGVLDANGAGSAGGAQKSPPPANGNPGFGPGRGNFGEAGPCVHGGGGGGAGYGGAGGTGGYVFNNNTGVYPNNGGTYGSDTNGTIELGSGGGGGGSSCDPPATNFGAAGGAGGGAIRIATGSLTVNGTISANGATGGGAPSDGGAGGGGSGGGIALFATTVAGAGVVSAKGGTGGTEVNSGFEGDGGGGGGGKIKLSGSVTFTTAVNGGAPGGPCTGGSFSCPAAGANGKVLVIGALLTPSPPSVAFGNQRVGTSSAPQQVTVTNSGGAALTVTSITTTAPYSVSIPTLPSTLDPGESLTFTATFSPTATGNANGSVSIVSNDPASPTTVVLTGTGTLPQLSSTPPPGSTIAFGNRRVGSTTNLNLVINNTGTATLNVANFATTGPFSSNGAGSAIAPGGTKTVVVSFTPTAAGNANGTLTFSTDDPNNPTASYTLTGTGIEPVIAVTPSPVAFGNQRINTTGNKVLTVNNTGTDKLTITALAVTGSGYATTNGVPLVVDPGSSVAIALTFKPTTLGPAAGNLRITSDAANGPTTDVPLTGTGVAPEITLDQSSISFGSQRVGTTGTRPLKITNTGTDTLTVFDIDSNSPFGDDSTALFTLAPGASQTIQVTFTPSLTVHSFGSLAINNDAINASNGQTLVPLDGTGIAPAIAVDPTALAFGNQRVGTTGTKTINVTNPGSDTLTITSITTAAPFANNDTTPISIGPGGNATLTVTFTPSATVSSAADLTIVSDAATSPTIVTLTGTGIEPAISTASSIDFGDQRVGTRGTRQLTISNTGTDTLTISTIASDNGVFPPDSAGPLVIAPGNQVQLNVNFDPAALGVVSATLTLTSDAATSPTAIALTGNGIAPQITAPAQLAFGFQRVNEASATKTVTLQNTGTDDLAISAITAPAPYVVTSPTSFPIIVPVGQTVDVDVVFTPTAVQTFALDLTITSDSLAGGTTIVNLTGQGVLPGLTASTATLTFGTIKLGDSSAGQVLTVTNTSVVKAVITSVDVPTQFEVEGLTLPVSLLPNASVPMTIKFKPTINGVASGTLTFVSDAETVPMIQLDGTGGTPVLAADPGTIDFGQVPLDTTSDPMPVTIRNTGNTPLVVTAIDAPAPFARASVQLPLTIAGGTSVSLNVMFRPSAVGVATGTITIQSDGGTSVIPLSGEGLAIDQPDDGGCCSSSGDVGSAWLGLGVLALVVFRPRRRRR